MFLFPPKLGHLLSLSEEEHRPAQRDLALDFIEQSVGRISTALSRDHRPAFPDCLVLRASLVDLTARLVRVRGKGVLKGFHEMEDFLLELRTWISRGRKEDAKHHHHPMRRRLLRATAACLLELGHGSEILRWLEDRCFRAAAVEALANREEDGEEEEVGGLPAARLLPVASPNVFLSPLRQIYLVEEETSCRVRVALMRCLAGILLERSLARSEGGEELFRKTLEVLEEASVREEAAQAAILCGVLVKNGEVEEVRTPPRRCC